MVASSDLTLVGDTTTLVFGITIDDDISDFELIVEKFKDESAGFDCVGAVLILVVVIAVGSAAVRDTDHVEKLIVDSAVLEYVVDLLILSFEYATDEF